MARWASSYSSIAASSAGSFAQRMTTGSSGPCTSSVSTMTPAVTNTIESRPSTGSPEAVVIGTDSAMASDTAPRNPDTVLTTRER